MTPLRIAFDAPFPQARWGPLFHVFKLERPDVELQWRPVGFPLAGQPLLADVDMRVILHPHDEDGVSSIRLDASPMVVLVAAGHPLAAQGDELRAADILDEVFPGAPSLHPEWLAFWTLDAQRGARPRFTAEDVRDAREALEVIASGRAIATLPQWAVNGLPHPGVIALPLADGPEVTTGLLWRTDDDNEAVRRLVELAQAWTADRHRSRRRRSASARQARSAAA
jgi:DNA-binding transcriptional LysR family regulator